MKVLDQVKADLADLTNRLREVWFNRKIRRSQSAYRAFAVVLSTIVLTIGAYGLASAVGLTPEAKDRSAMLSHLIRISVFEFATEHGEAEGELSTGDLEVHRKMLDRVVNAYEARSFSPWIRSLIRWDLDPGKELRKIQHSLLLAEQEHLDGAQVSAAIAEARKDLIALAKGLKVDPARAPNPVGLSSKSRAELADAISIELVQFETNSIKLKRAFDNKKMDDAKYLAANVCQNSRSLLSYFAIWVNGSEDLHSSGFLKKFVEIHGSPRTFDRNSYGKSPCLSETQQIPAGAMVPELVQILVEVSANLDIPSCKGPAHYADSIWTRYEIASELSTNPESGMRPIDAYIARNLVED